MKLLSHVKSDMKYQYLKQNINKEGFSMPTISMFRGIKIFINWNEHQPPHFHAKYAGSEILVSINDIEVLEGTMANKQ
jgi:hypothetical protein